MKVLSTWTSERQLGSITHSICETLSNTPSFSVYNQLVMNVLSLDNNIVVTLKPITFLIMMANSSTWYVASVIEHTLGHCLKLLHWRLEGLDADSYATSEDTVSYRKWSILSRFPSRIIWMVPWIVCCRQACDLSGAGAARHFAVPACQK